MCIQSRFCSPGTSMWPRTGLMKHVNRRWVFISVVICGIFLSAWALLRSSESRETTAHYHRLHRLEYRYVRYNESVCESLPKMLVIVLVKSKTRNGLRRKLFRRLWGAARAYGKTAAVVRTVFVLGATTDSETEVEVAGEFQKYGDIVQVGVADDARYSTVLTLMALKWASVFCSNSAYVLLAGDDSVLQLDLLVDFLPLLENSPDGRHPVYFGRRIKGGKPTRERGAEDYVSEEEYFPQRYPTYVQGPPVLLSRHLTRLFAEMCAEVPYLHLDDVFLGLCAERWAVLAGHHDQMKPPGPSASRPEKFLKLRCYFAFEMPNMLLQKQFWNFVRSSKRQTCSEIRA